jgi:hypothetical protein
MFFDRKLSQIFLNEVQADPPIALEFYNILFPG